MTKNQKKDLATSLTTLTFLVIATTGVMMYFHLFGKYTKEMHEILGLVFVVAVIFHVLFNFNSMKQYFSKKIFYIISCFTFVIVLLFIYNAPEQNHQKRIVYNTVVNANIENSFLLFVDDMDLVMLKLENAGITVDSAKSIKEIAKKNNISSSEIIKILTD